MLKISRYLYSIAGAKWFINPTTAISGGMADTMAARCCQPVHTPMWLSIRAVSGRRMVYRRKEEELY
jgi:hypothetical protein